MMLSPLLLLVAYCDLRYMRIPNSISIIAIGSFAVLAVFFPVDDLSMRLLVAAIAFGIGFLGFCFRILGGGDVKILAALFLFIPVSGLTVFMYLFSAALVLGVVLILVLRTHPINAVESWKAVSHSTKFPMGISIAAAGIAHPYIIILL